MVAASATRFESETDLDYLGLMTGAEPFAVAEYPIDATTANSGLNLADIKTTLDTQDDARVRSLLQDIDALEAVSGQSWTATLLQEAASDNMILSLRRLALNDDPALLSVIDRAIPVESAGEAEEVPFMHLVQDVFYPLQGAMYQWASIAQRSNDQPTFFSRLMERPYFAGACLESALNELEQDFAAERYRVHAARRAEQGILTALGLDPERITEYQTAIAKRTLLVDEEGEVMTVGEGGGLDIETWAGTLGAYIEIYQYLGAERAARLREDWGIINLDRYTPVQLERMCRLSEGDPELLEKLRNNDVKIVASDAFGDYSNAAEDDIRVQDTGDETTLFFEIDHPVSVYKPFVKLWRRFGIKASTIAISDHSNTGYFSFGIKGHRYHPEFSIGIEDVEGEPLSWNDSVHYFNVDKTSVGRFVHEYMIPGRETGVRNILLLGCLAANPTPGKRISIAEALLRKTAIEDEVRLAASEDIVSWNYQEQLPWNDTDDEPARILVHQRISVNGVRIAHRDTWPGLPEPLPV